MKFQVIPCFPGTNFKFQAIPSFLDFLGPVAVARGQLDLSDVNPFLTNIPTLQLWFSSVIRGYKIGTLARNGLIIQTTDLFT